MTSTLAIGQQSAAERRSKLVVFNERKPTLLAKFQQIVSLNHDNDVRRSS